MDFNGPSHLYGDLHIFMETLAPHSEFLRLYGDLMPFMPTLALYSEFYAFTVTSCPLWQPSHLTASFTPLR